MRTFKIVSFAELRRVASFAKTPKPLVPQQTRKKRATKKQLAALAALFNGGACK